MHSTTTSKIKNFVEETLINSIEHWTKMLVQGDLHSYEKELSKRLTDIHDFMSEQLLTNSSEEVFEQLKMAGKILGAKKIVARSMSVRIGTGHTIKVKSPYAKNMPEDWKGSRHLLAEHWKMVKGVSPFLYDKAGYSVALCPSYDSAHQLLKKFGTEVCISSVRKISNNLANHCFDYGEAELMLKLGEHLAGKRVVISLDGGRTRTREYTGEFNEMGHATYETKWKEPKLFVIDVLEDDGQLSRHRFPIYGCRFEEEAVLELLKSYLEKMRIYQAKEVQILADGAPWIWTRLQPLLKELKVKSHRIVETLDYYHASEYIHDLVANMPKRIGKKKKNAYLTQFKEWLWNGEISQIIHCCKQVYQRPTQLISRWIEYLNKHQKRMQYAVFEKNKLMCGSGIIESGIRRIINLRFKNASTFWEKENVEKLYFLRVALLSKRWDIVMTKLSNSA